MFDFCRSSGSKKKGGESRVYLVMKRKSKKKETWRFFYTFRVGSGSESEPTIFQTLNDFSQRTCVKVKLWDSRMVILLKEVLFVKVTLNIISTFYISPPSK